MRAAVLHPYSHPYNSQQHDGFGGPRLANRACSADVRLLPLRSEVSYTIFEGTSEIQRLVVARAVSGFGIERCTHARHDAVSRRPNGAMLHARAGTVCTDRKMRLGLDPLGYFTLRQLADASLPVVATSRSATQMVH